MWSIKFFVLSAAVLISGSDSPWISLREMLDRFRGAIARKIAEGLQVYEQFLLVSSYQD